MAAIPLLSFAATAHAQETPASPSTSLSASVGGAIWSGDFGAATNTQIVSVLVSARYQIGGVRLVASIPRMRIRSDGTFFTGIGGTPLFIAPNVRPVDRVRSGFGDLTIGASYLLPRGEERGFDVDFSARVKIPTASDSSRLSTGKVDYSVGVDLSKPIGRLTPAVSVVYRGFGDNREWNFRNGFDVTIGTSYAVGSASLVTLNYEYARAASNFIRDAHELLLGGSVPVARDRLRATAYISKGLSSGAAAVAAGAGITIKF